MIFVGGVDHGESGKERQMYRLMEVGECIFFSSFEKFLFCQNLEQVKSIRRYGTDRHELSHANSRAQLKVALDQSDVRFPGTFPVTMMMSSQNF